MCNKVGTENIVPRYRTITELAKESGITLISSRKLPKLSKNITKKQMLALLTITTP